MFTSRQGYIVSFVKNWLGTLKGALRKGPHSLLGELNPGCFQRMFLRLQLAIKPAYF